MRLGSLGRSERLGMVWFAVALSVNLHGADVRYAERLPCDEIVAERGL